MPGQLDASGACTSLHQVPDLAAVVDLAAQALVPDGRAVIVEWAREQFDKATRRTGPRPEGLQSRTGVFACPPAGLR